MDEQSLSTEPWGPPWVVSRPRRGHAPHPTPARPPTQGGPQAARSTEAMGGGGRPRPAVRSPPGPEVSRCRRLSGLEKGARSWRSAAAAGGACHGPAQVWPPRGSWTQGPVRAPTNSDGTCPGGRLTRTCSAVQRSAVRCSAVRCSAVRCRTALEREVNGTWKWPAPACVQ